MLDEIQEHFAKEYPREACGVIAIVKGRKKWFPCTNVAKEDSNFILSSNEYFKIKVQHDIIAIVHNHPDGSNKPSETDVNNCNALGIPYYIYSYPEMELNVIEPKQKQYPRVPFEEGWWEKKGLNYFCPEVIKGWGGKEISSPQENDVLIFTVDSGVPNHCGVYIGNDTFFHHARNRLSCREHLYPFWIKHLTGVYRYDANSLS
jgi:proteasome lid subunit RPN8/RPN11